MYNPAQEAMVYISFVSSVTHQLRSMDSDKRKLEFVEQCDPVTWTQVLSTINQFI
ncbi:hypothetical protein AB1A63_03875 [Lactiplantibacillus paraplantarum]|uniref:hypothetical protein n=1 Tax=Lactiplantibacillus paraplantarum TaxID=60520 RepID=UPI0021A5C2FA|nr:hypothetical protein [Lactiplantibacillus paraplantarum]